MFFNIKTGQIINYYQTYPTPHPKSEGYSYYDQYFFFKKTPLSSIWVLDQILNDTELAWTHLYAHKIQTKYFLKLKY